MASSSKDKRGRWRVEFFVPGCPKRKTLRLGVVAQRVAEEIEGKIERIVASQKAGLTLDEATEAWVARLPENLRQRLVQLQVISDGGRRQRSSLGGFIEDYLAARTDLKPGTHANLRAARIWLEKFFGAERDLGSVTPGEADLYRAWLETEAKQSENTIRGLCRKARQFFRAAYRQRLIHENPFAGMKRLTDLASPEDRKFYVSRSLAEQVLAHCPTDEWKLIFALCRYGGLRCPTEILALRWSDVDWKREQFTVTCIKTARYDGRGTRTVPLFPELRPFLEACFRAKSGDSEWVISRIRNPKTNLRTQMKRILKRAGIEVWPKLFQNLRSSRESELMKIHGVEVACAWIGNTPAVATKHYLQITDQDYEQALEAWRAVNRKAV